MFWEKIFGSHLLVADFELLEGDGAAPLGGVLDEVDGVVPRLVRHLPVQLGEALAVVLVRAEVRRHQQELEVVDHVGVHELHHVALDDGEAAELGVALHISHCNIFQLPFLFNFNPSAGNVF